MLRVCFRPIAFLILITAAPLHAQGSLADLVPPETLFFAEYDDLDGGERAGAKSALARIREEPEVQRFLAGMKEAIAKGVAGQRAQGPDVWAMAGLEPGDVLGIRVRRAAFAIVGADPARDGYPDVVLVLQLRSGADKVQKILGQMRAATLTFLGVGWESALVEGVTIHHASTNDVEVAYAIDGDRVVVATGRARVEKTLAMTKAGGKRPSLLREPTYMATRASMGAENAQMFVYLGARPLAGLIRPQLDESERGRFDAFVSATGLDAVESLALADIPAGANLRTEFCIRARERKGFLRLWQAAPTAHRFRGMAPRDPLLYGAERYDLAPFLRDMLAFADAMEPGSEAEFRALVARYDAVLGIDLEKDLLASLGDEWGMYVGGTPGGSLVPDMVMLLSLKDRGKFEKSIRALVEKYPDVLRMYGKERAPRIRHRRTSFEGQDIHLLELSTHRGDPIPIVPCWTVADDHVAFALWPHALKHLRTRRPGFDTNPAYAALLPHVPDGVVSQTYFDLPRVVGFAYNSLVPVLQGMQGALDRKLAPYGASLNLHDLPRAEVITRHLSPCVSYTKVQDDAIRLGYVSPCGMSLVAGGIAALGGAIAAAVNIDSDGPGMREEEDARHERADLERRRERAEWEARIREMEREVEELRRLLEELEEEGR